MSGQSHPEYELVLMVRSPDPAAVLEKISGLASVGNYRLKARETEDIRDVYFDTPDRSLSIRRLNLRLRYLSNVVRITLKQSPRLFTRNRNERREIELDWSFASLSKVLQEISDRGIRLESADPGESDPRDILKILGLVVIQDRETKRKPREVVSVRGEILAEVAIDSVTYHFEEANIMLDEVEVESKSKNGKEAVDEVIENLTLAFGPELQRWRSGKLSTGMKIERLLRNGSLDGLLQEGRLKLDAYNLLLRN